MICLRTPFRAHCLAYLRAARSGVGARGCGIDINVVDGGWHKRQAAIPAGRRKSKTPTAYGGSISA